MSNLKERWNIKSNWQMAIIFVVFAITGTTASYLSKPILAWLGITKDNLHPVLYWILYILIILPVYKVLLVTIGTIFGQHTFFKNFVFKMLRGMKLGFIADLFGNKKGV
ncbi:hypothetical protein FCR2A7T_28270 [Flavobacterium cauense R2A-7]|nr:DUF6787 family protein [Flavobacterium cauense]ESU18534.1 hypothetical protein FCR2A7T_28270 [Flavobacterium cauense R2A-7]KGO80624.1 diacylglyceryl transferase [Flavobacterium cauense R2A-7]